MKLIRVTSVVQEMVIPLVKEKLARSTNESNSNKIGIKAFHSYPESEWFRAFYPHADLEDFAIRCTDSGLYTLVCNGALYIQMRNTPINTFSWKVKDLYDQHMAEDSIANYA